MAKTHRGHGLRGEYHSGRGTCPVCNRTGVKILYNREIGEKTINTCKRCNVALGRGKLQDVVSNLS